jgi:hypothetical protein
MAEDSSLNVLAHLGSHDDAVNPRLLVGVGDRCALSRRPVSEIPVRVARIATEFERHGLASQHRPFERNNRPSTRSACRLAGHSLRGGQARQQAGEKTASQSRLRPSGE